MCVYIYSTCTTIAKYFARTLNSANWTMQFHYQSAICENISYILLGEMRYFLSCQISNRFSSSYARKIRSLYANMETTHMLWKCLTMEFTKQDMFRANICIEMCQVHSCEAQFSAFLLIILMRTFHVHVCVFLYNNPAGNSSQHSDSN